MLILPDFSYSSSNKFLRATNKNHQPGIFPTQSELQPQPALLSKRPTDSSHHGRRGYWFQLVGCDSRQYGGLYSLAEADAILSAFKGHQGQITAADFGQVAERVIAATAAGRGAS